MSDHNDKPQHIGDIARELYASGFANMSKRRLSQFERAHYKSPIEEIFAWRARNWWRDYIILLPQFRVDVGDYLFVLDFVAIRHDRECSRIIAIECDGKDYHNHNKDLWRDTRILSSANVPIDAIYRFRGVDLFYNEDLCIQLLAKAEPWFFIPSAYEQFWPHARLYQPDDERAGVRYEGARITTRYVRDENDSDDQEDWELGDIEMSVRPSLAREAWLWDCMTYSDQPRYEAPRAGVKGF